VTRHYDHRQRAKVQGPKVTERISSNNAVTQQRIVISTSNLMEIMFVGGSLVGAFSRSVGQINKK